MKTDFDRRKSLQELEHDDWGEPNFDSNLVRTCHRLRRIPLADFSAGDLRIMIGQKISLMFLVPLALEKLNEDPLLEASYFRGDLLNVVLDVPDTFWNVHTDRRAVFRKIIRTTMELLSSLDETDAQFVRENLERASSRFLP